MRKKSAFRRKCQLAQQLTYIAGRCLAKTFKMFFSQNLTANVHFL